MWCILLEGHRSLLKWLSDKEKQSDKYETVNSRLLILNRRIEQSGVARSCDIFLQKVTHNAILLASLQFSGGVYMAISYNKLWKILIDRKMSNAELRKAAGLAPNTMTKLRRDEPVAMIVLEKICRALDADVGDIVQFVKVSDDN